MLSSSLAGNTGERVSGGWILSVPSQNQSMKTLTTPKPNPCCHLKPVVVLAELIDVNSMGAGEDEFIEWVSCSNNGCLGIESSSWLCSTSILCGRCLECSANAAINVRSARGGIVTP